MRSAAQQVPSRAAQSSRLGPLGTPGREAKRAQRRAAPRGRALQPGGRGPPPPSRSRRGGRTGQPETAARRCLPGPGARAPPTVAVGSGLPVTPQFPSPPHPVGSSKARPKKSLDQRAQTAARALEVRWGRKHWREESPRDRQGRGVASGARAVLAPRGHGAPQPSVPHAESPTSTNQRPPLEARGRDRGLSPQDRACDRKGELGVAGLLANRDEES
ncbi:hypothetical protein HispidOSU_019212 [Sigmodon hispidus]